MRMWNFSYLTICAGFLLISGTYCDEIRQNDEMDIVSKIRSMEFMLLKQGRTIELLQEERANDRALIDQLGAELREQRANDHALIDKLKAEVREQTEMIADLEAKHKEDRMRIERIEMELVTKSPVVSGAIKSAVDNTGNSLKKLHLGLNKNQRISPNDTTMDYHKAGIITSSMPSGLRMSQQPVLSDESRQFEKRHVQRSMSRRLLVASSNKIAFSATLSKRATGLGTEHPIPFDKMIVNYGNAYDSAVHTFFCPVNGVYFFHVSIMADNHGHIETELVKDGVPLIRNYASGHTTAYGFNQGSNAVVVTCNQGEHVWVRVRSNYGTTVYDEDFSIFSGYLLFPI